ncbi:protein TASOR 2 isoform X2 [Cebidichthys violaceus]|uniref:protein TASOR 2 isoform X2 n=1 Tax=Cebidichthys violaceus TaxID=271503 RepID=UPI0035CA697E
MESGNGGASSKGVLVPVSERSDVFLNSILAPLKTAYLYEESRRSFRYKSAVLVKNPALEEKYNAFREKRREVGYSEEDLKESYGFLLFEDINQANALSETGVPTGNSTCTTLGDPSKGVYISMYSDCLDLNRWYHGKSGYIAIIRLSKGRVKNVLENYTQNFTAPTVGFDCHVSEQLPSVSPKTSSFLAFERSQYYMYELLDDGSNVTNESPSAACPIAVVSFSYTDTKATLEAAQENGEEKKLFCQYFPWRGQLQIGPQFYDVGLRSTAGALIPAVLPPVVKIDRAISMFNLRQLLPRAVFETCFSGEVFLDGLYCSLCELVSSEVEETHSLSLLLQEIKEKDLALTIQLNDGGFLILLHSTHFLTYDDTGSSVTDVLQGMFVFPNSQVIQRDTKFRAKKHAMSSEILHVLPVLSYAEGEVEKTPIDPSEELCEVLAQHMQTYAALINPGLASSPTREVSFFPDQYDVPDAHKHLYSSPEWTNRAWQSFRSYLSKPDSFQLPLSKASEILAAGQEERMEDLDDDVYICLSSPEGPPTKSVGIESEDQLTGQRSPVNSETPVDTWDVESQVDLKTVPQNVVPDDVQAGDDTKDTGKSSLSVLIKADDMGAKNHLTPSTSDDLPAELIVSITSAEQTVTDEGLSIISTVSGTKRNDFQLSGFSTAKLQTEGVNSLNDESVTTKKVLDCPEAKNLTKTKRRKLRRGHYKIRKKVSKACIKTHSLKVPVEDGNLSQKEYQAKDSSGHPQLSHPSNSDRRKVQMRKCKFRQLSSKTEKVGSASVGLAVPEEKKTEPGQQSLESTIFMDFEASPLRKKTERWDLKPVISECGRILVPHGSVDFADQIKSLKEKFQSTKDEQCSEKMLVDTSVKAHDSDKMVQESSPTPETTVGETEATTSKDGGNHLQHVVSDVNPEHSILEPAGDGSSSLALNSESIEDFSKTDGTATPLSEAVEGKRADTLSPGKIAKKGEFLLSKLKSVLLRGKRKTDLLVSEKTTADTTQCTEPCLKKGKVDSHSGNLKSNYAIMSVQDTNVCVKEVSKMLSVDPIFAYALGLTPKEPADKIQKTDGQDTQQEQSILGKQPQILHRPSPIFARRGRIKTLKKHQGISTEYVKKKCTPFPVSPLSGSTRLLRHHQTMYGNGIKTLHPSVGQEDSSEQNHRTPEYLKKHMVRRRKFRHSRTFVNKDGSIQVTKQWKEDYDFNLDSKFTNDSKDRTIVRALHGPWDFSLQDTNEEVRLIVHMWIGLFYSRSTDRFFHVDSYPCSEESDSLEVSSGMVSATAQSELKANTFAPFPSITGTLISKDLDFSNKDDSMLDQGSGILDLSLRNSNAEIVSPDPQVNRKETSVSIDRKEASETLNTLESSLGPQEAIAKQRSKKMVHSREIINEMNDARSADENKRTCTPLQKAGSLEHTNVPSCKDDGTIISVREEMERVSVQPENHQTASGTSPVLHGCNNKKTDVKNGIENSEATEMSSVQKHGRDSSKSVTDEEVDSNREAGDVLHTVEHDETESKNGESWKVKEKPDQEGNVEPSPKGSHANEDPTNDELGIVCNGKGLENEKQLPTEEPKAVSSVQKHGRDSSKSVTGEEVDSNREAGDVLHTVEHDKTESKDGENWKVKEKPDQEGIEPSPKVILTNEDLTNEDLGIACNGNVLENEKQLPTEEPKAVSSVQKHGRDSSKSVTDKEVDSNTEAGDVLHTVEHDETESKDGENWEVKEKPDQEGIEPSPKVILTNEELGIVCNGNGLENEKQLPTEEPRAVSPGKAENVNEDVDCCSVHEGKEMEDEDHIGKEDGLDEKDGWISPMDTDSELSDQPVPMICYGPDPVKTDCITESNPEPPLDEQPPQADNKEDPCHDLQLCANSSVLTDEHAISERCTHAPSEMDPFSDEPAVEKSSENDICLTSKVHYQKPALHLSDDNKCKDGPIPQTNDSVETGSQNKVMANFNRGSDDHEDLDTKAIKGTQGVDNTTEKELFSHQTHSPQCEAEVERTKETDLKQIDKTNEALEKIHNEVVIPFIGIDTSGEVKLRPHDSHSQGKVEEVVQGQEEIPFISETTYPETVLPTEVCSASQMDTQKAELSAGKISLIDASDTNHLGGESDDRCSTPTMDEKPYEYLTSSGPRSTSVSAFSGSETSKNMTPKLLSRSSTSIKDEMTRRSTVNCEANPHHDRHPDVELRTLRVLQSIDKFLSKSSLGDKSSQIETADMKRTLDQTANPRSKNITTCFASSHTSFDSKDKKMSNTAPVVVPASTSQELKAESAGHFLISPFKIKLEEVLGVKLQLQKTDSSVHQHYFERTDNIQETSPEQDYCQPYRSVPSTESLQAINPNVEQGVHTTTSQTNLSHEPRSYSQRPIMAVKPSKSDESPGDYISKDRQIENAVMSHFSKDKQIENLKVTYTIPATMLSGKNTESLKRTSEGVNVDKQIASELSSKSSWLSNVGDSKPQDISKFNKMPSPLPVQSFESARSSSKPDGNQGSVEKVEQTTKMSIQMTQKDCSDASTSLADYSDLSLGPQSSLTCTVYNNPRKRSSSFLEQVSQRCIQDDLTAASMEQECLIFSEKMKHLMKRSKRGPISQQETHDKLNLPCTSPLIVHFCSLEEQDDSVDHLTTHLDAPLVVGQKIKVDMSERKDLADSTDEEKTLRLQNISQGAGNPMEHAGVSGVTSECTRLYKARMKDVCAVQKVPSRPKHFRMDRGYPKTEPGNHFDFCDQMKRELDKSFRSNLNSVVKKSCKTKYRFYILVTSDDAFFEETKAQLEAEGHTAVQPSQFFLDEDSSSSLLIILRNEDIAEHICEVPHLVKLKTSPGVQFAGIDEPDDVVNLTHQELFTRGGFIMFDSAALEPLSLCNMKKMTEILQERSRMGRWKWMMHYRDSRRLKENARLSKEAKDKKLFLNFCQEAGILEVLPYHECDLMSRDLPDYLTCLVRLQVQNISARYPIFITDTTTDSAFGKNGILTMTFQSFLTSSPSETFTA